MMKRFRNQRGAALIETAITIPLVLLVSVAIFEFGRAYQTWQVLTNAAREGARVAVLESYTDAQVTTIVQNYLTGGRLTNTPNIQVVRNVPFGSSTASRVTVNYPFQFMVIGLVAKLVRSTSKVGAPLTMQSSALMRNE
jgi:Flp pilus assembly protein TadG